MVSHYLGRSFVPVHVFTVTIIFKSMRQEKETLQGVTFSLTLLSIKYKKLNGFPLVFCGIGNYSCFVIEKKKKKEDLLVILVLPVLARTYNRMVKYNDD